MKKITLLLIILTCFITSCNSKKEDKPFKELLPKYKYVIDCYNYNYVDKTKKSNYKINNSFQAVSLYYNNYNKKNKDNILLSHITVEFDSYDEAKRFYNDNNYKKEKDVILTKKDNTGLITLNTASYSEGTPNNFIKVYEKNGWNNCKNTKNKYYQK